MNIDSTTKLDIIIVIFLIVFISSCSIIILVGNNNTIEHHPDNTSKVCVDSNEVLNITKHPKQK